MAHEAVVIVAAGARRYAVRQAQVGGLQRADRSIASPALGTLLGVEAGIAAYALGIAGSANTVLVDGADLLGTVPCCQLPRWLQAHPAVAGLAFDGAEWVVLVDLVRLASHTG